MMNVNQQDSENRPNRGIRLALALTVVGLIVGAAVVMSKESPVVSTRAAVENSPLDDEPFTLDDVDPVDVTDDIAFGHVASLGTLAGAPFVVRLVTKSGKGFCTGSIVSPKLVITAKHCLNRAPNQIYVVAGIYKVGVNTYRQWKTGLRYIKSTQADMGLIQVSSPFRFGRYVNKVSLGYRRPPTNAQVYAFGWGGTQQLNGVSKVLKYARMRIVPNSVCRNSRILARQMCAKDVTGNVCGGDSGGPLVRRVIRRWWLVGTVQGGAGLGCADRTSGDKFEVVSSYRRWILYHIARVG